MSLNVHESSVFFNFLFQNMDEFLHEVFLFLDPVSLKNCRCVSKQWNNLIQNSVWQSEVGRKVLNTKLTMRWKTGTPCFLKFQIGGSKGVSWIECDETFAYIRALDEFVGAYDIATGKTKFEVYLSEKNENYWPMISVGKDYIATTRACDSVVTLLDRHTGEICQVEEERKCSAVKMAENRVVVIGGCDITQTQRRRVSILEKIDGNWKVTGDRDAYADGHVNSADDVAVDGDWLVMSSFGCCNVWKISEVEEGFTHDIGAEPWRMILHYPYLFMSNGWYGLDVWNVEKDVHIRNYEVEDQYLEFISSNGEFVAFCAKFNEGEAIREQVLPPPRQDVPTYVFEIKELIDDNIENEELWKRRISCAVYEGDFLRAALNQTSLILSHGRAVEVYKFWND